MIKAVRSEACQQKVHQARRNQAIAELSNRELFHRAKTALTELEAVEEALFKEYDQGILKLVDQSMLARYRTDHQSFWKRMFLSTFRRDQKILRHFRKSALKLSLDDGLALIQQVLGITGLQQAWAEMSEELRTRMRSRIDGRRTDWKAIEADLSRTEVELKKIECSEVERRPELEKRFGGFYNGFETDWEQVNSALNWVAELLTIVDKSEITVNSRSSALRRRTQSLWTGCRLRSVPPERNSMTLSVL